MGQHKTQKKWATWTPPKDRDERFRNRRTQFSVNRIALNSLYYLFLLINMTFGNACWNFTRLTWRVLLVKQELLTFLLHLSSPSASSGVRVARSLASRIVFYRLLILLSCFHWALYCLSVFNLRLPITHLVSSNIFIYISVVYLR